MPSSRRFSRTIAEVFAPYDDLMKSPRMQDNQSNFALEKKNLTTSSYKACYLLVKHRIHLQYIHFHKMKRNMEIPFKCTRTA